MSHYTEVMHLPFAFSDSGGVVSRLHVSPIPLLVGCGLLAVAGLLTRRMAQRVAQRPLHAVDTRDVVRQAALVGLVFTMLVAIALIAAGLFEYR